MEAVSKDFDLVVHERDKRTGRVIGSNPYRLHCRGDIKIFERNGGFYFQNGEEVPNDIVTYVLGYDPAKGAPAVVVPDQMARARAALQAAKAETKASK